jgi:hypothetical protein
LSLTLGQGSGWIHDEGSAGHHSPGPDSSPAPAGVRPAALAGPLLGDVIAPTVTYYLARGLGAPAAAALVLGGACAANP